MRRADALANLQTLAGGQVYITYRHRTAAGEYAQGYLVQIDPWVETFVQVLP